MVADAIARKRTILIREALCLSFDPLAKIATNLCRLMQWQRASAAMSARSVSAVLKLS
jgi:hypothetical protein